MITLCRYKLLPNYEADNSICICEGVVLRYKQKDHLDIADASSGGITTFGSLRVNDSGGREEEEGSRRQARANTLGTYTSHGKLVTKLSSSQSCPSSRTLL